MTRTPGSAGGDRDHVSEISLPDQIRDAAAFIRERSPLEPRVGLILGTGLGDVSGVIENPVRIPYQDVPGFVVSTSEKLSGLALAAALPARSRKQADTYLSPSVSTGSVHTSMDIPGEYGM